MILYNKVGGKSRETPEILDFVLRKIYNYLKYRAIGKKGGERMGPRSFAAKHTARVSLKGKWPAAVGICLLACGCLLLKALVFMTVSDLLVSFMPSGFLMYALDAAAAFVVTVLEFFAFSPLYVGILRWFWRVTAGADDPVSSVFCCYDSKADYRKSISMIFAVLWRTLVAVVISFAPFAYFLAATTSLERNFAFNSDGERAILYFVCGATAVLGGLVVVLYLTRLYLVFPVIFSDDSVTVRDAVKLSKSIAKGNRAVLFYTVISFSGWLLLSFLVLPMLFTVPYFVSTMSVFARYSINDRILQAEKSAE